MFTRANARDALLSILPKSSTGAEVGVWRGDFAGRLLTALQPKLLYLIDPWKVAGGEKSPALYGTNNQTQASMDGIYDAVRKRFSKPVETGHVTIMRSSSAEALTSLPDGSLDWIYLDGDHTYEGVKSDLDMALRKVRLGGIIAGDDYGAQGWWDQGVTRAVHHALSEAGGHLRMRLLIETQYALVRV